MQTTNAAQAGNVQRIVREFSLKPEEERRRDELLRTAWMNIVAGFPRRPEPSSPWNHAADYSEARWNKIVRPIRSAIASAVVMGDKQLIEQTLEGARAFCRELEADFASLVPAQEEESIVTVALEETDSQGPADAVQMALVAHPTPTNADRAIRPLEHQYERLGALIKKCRRAARQTATPMAAMIALRPLTPALAGKMAVWVVIAILAYALVVIAVGRFCEWLGSKYPPLVGDHGEYYAIEDQDYEEGTEPPRRSA